MKEQLIDFQTAKLAKEKGFGIWSYEPSGCIQMYNEKSEKIDNLLVRQNFPHDFQYILVSQSLLQRWLREKYSIHVFIGYRPNTKKWDSSAYELTLDGKEYAKSHSFKKFLDKIIYNTYEEAVEAGLIEGLNLIK